jgi:aryl-alcohol dehydrogenase-like predicted oxidoreductase
MMFGGATTEADAAHIIDSARESGINFIDTANVYNEGESEIVVGRAIAAHRNWWILATKLGNPTGLGPNEQGLSRRYTFAAVEASLRRIKVDVIDILYLHKEDHSTPLEEVVETMADLTRTGRIRHFGVSNHRAWRVAEISRLCDQAGIGRPIVSQPYYNALNRMPEVEHLPACKYFGLGVFSYSPLARGVLTGKYKPNAQPEEGSRAGRKDKRILETEWREESLVAAQTIAAHAASRGITPGQFATAWVLNNALVTGAIAGPRTMSQWSDYLGALDYRFTADDEALVDGLVPPGHPSTPGYNDPAYPLEGRIPR